MASLDRSLSKLHGHLAACALFARLVVFTRLLLAAGFVIPGTIKLLGHRFTVLGTDTPVGDFFEAMYRTGAYWRFLGLTQVVAAVLVLVPRLALVGASLFFGLMLNIAVLTNAIGFQGTRWVTIAMLGATVFLLFWDYPALRPALGLRSPGPVGLTPVRLRRIEWVGAVLATALSWYSLLFTFGVLHLALPLALAIAGATAAVGIACLFGPALRERWLPRTE